MSLPAGTRLGPYEILAPLGSGGMGEVFKARDTRLGRTVAIKILRPELVGFADGRARFEREARAIASLAHPHICTLHDVGHQDDLDFLVMELLDGETLAERLGRGPLSVGDTLAYARQIADALDRAHQQGIVHRDLKPANVMLTRSGAKLLDFGLARLRPGPAPGAEAMTQAAALATEGVILGTLPYMAPEQLEGKEADARTDLFAFGAVVHEMATGRRAFEAPSQAGLIGAILKSAPPAIATVNPAVPPALDRIVKLCLAKNPDERWSTAHDVLLLLKDIHADARSGAEQTASSRGDRQGRAGWIVAAVALIAVAVLAARTLWPRADAPLGFVSVLPAPGTTLTPGEAP
jgi:serine/threonine protein kinase